MKNRVFTISLNFIFGLICSFIGFVNCFWGNDPFYGYFITLLSLIFYIPLFHVMIEMIKPNVMVVIRVIIGLFIVWSSLGVGELVSKVELMHSSFPLPMLN
jgi:uncharacterized membrane protein